MKILLIGVLLFMSGCMEYAVYDCTGADRDKMGEYMEKCRGGSREMDCVNNVQELFCKPAFKVKR